jgi:hypothetical protein
MTADGDARRTPPSAGDVPNEEEVAREFPHGTDAPLREQRPLIDEDGVDIREYTGEPVETEYGTVLPQQMAVGSERVVGGGEFPNSPGRHERGVDAGDRDEETPDRAP